MRPLIEVLWDKVLGSGQEPSTGSRPVVPGHGVGVGDRIDVRGKSSHLFLTRPEGTVSSYNEEQKAAVIPSNRLPVSSTVGVLRCPTWNSIQNRVPQIVPSQRTV